MIFRFHTSDMNRLDRKHLELLAEWQLLRGHINALIRDYTEDMLDAALRGDVPRTMSLAGVIKGLKIVLVLPDELMPGNPKGESA
jgi:hypothetical protein